MSSQDAGGLGQVSAQLCLLSHVSENPTRAMCTLRTLMDVLTFVVYNIATIYLYIYKIDI